MAVPNQCDQRAAAMDLSNCQPVSGNKSRAPAVGHLKAGPLLGDV